MINTVILVGRLTKDLELKKTQSNLSVLQFTLAVNQGKKDESGKYKTDFINCVAWRQSADYLSSYAQKGDLISVAGSLSTRSYDKNGTTIYVTEVVCDKVSILSHAEKKPVDLGFNEPLGVEQVNITSDDLPFNEQTSLEPSDLPFY